MTLLIDVGNSAVKWSWFDGGEFAAGGRQLHRGAGDLTALLVAGWGELGRGRRAVGCNVAADAVRQAVDAAARKIGIGRVEWLTSQDRSASPVELISGYRDPAQLGADRWHAMLGAIRARPGTSIVVVNAGTAITADCVHSTGATSARFVGGCIAPGARLMHESLSQRAAGLPLSDGEPMAFPDSTASAIATGVLDAQAGLVERVWTRFAQRLDAMPQVLLAGGNASQLVTALPTALRAAVEDNLVLRGLAVRLEAE